MLYFLGVWLLLFLACGIIGTGVIRYLGMSVDRSTDHFFLAVWLGLLLVAVALLAVSLILPLSPLVGGGGAMLLAAIALCQRSTRSDLRDGWKQRVRLQWGVIGSVMVAIAALSSQAVTWNDTGLYHYSVIRWLADYGTVRGLALLFSNFGFTSSWFALAAPLNPTILGDRGSAVANGFIFLLAVLHYLLSANRIIQFQASRSDWFMVAFLSLILPLSLGFRLLVQIRISPSQDFPIILLTGVIAWACLLVAASDRLLDQTETKSKTKLGSAIGTSLRPDFSMRAVLENRLPFPSPPVTLIPLILAAGAFTVKLIALPLLLGTALQFGYRSLTLPGQSIWQRCRWLLIGGLVVSGLIAPLILHSLMTSGCPLFPSSRFCLDVPWSPPALELQAVTQGTQQWTTWYGTPPPGMPPWVWSLMKWLTTERVNQLFAGLLVVSIATAFYVVPAAIKQNRSEDLWVVAIACLGISFMMMTAPFFRFACGFLALVPALAIARYADQDQRLLPLLRSRLQRWHRLPTARWTTAIAIGLATLVTLTQLQGEYGKGILPPPLQRVTTIQRRSNDVIYHSPVGEELCWASPLPCAFTVENVKLRDPARGISAGFVRSDNGAVSPPISPR